MKLFRKIKGKLGFTLAEMLIVVAILAILTAVAAPNVAKYSRSINLRELNDSARAIYMAAEHKFMNEIEMGNELPGLDDGAAKITALLPRYDETSEVDIFYLKSNDSGSPLKKLMSSGGTDVESTGVVESQLFDNNFIVEYNPKTGDVYGVFYSEKENFDDYTTNFYSDVADVQSKKLIGYYGSDNVKPEEKTNSEVYPKPEVTIINKEKLVVRITAPEVSGGEPISIKVKVNDTWIVPETGYNIVPGTTVDLILDSLISSGKPAIATTLVKSYEASIADWLGAPVEDCSDMTLTVTFYDKDGKTRDQSVTKTFNPLFANGSTADTAYIEYGRHLQNLDKCSAINTAVIKRTIDFKAPGKPDVIRDTTAEEDNYEHWSIVYKKTSKFGGYEDLKFRAVTTSATNISAKPGVQIRHLNTDDGGIFASLTSTKVTGLVVVNPLVVGVNCGAIACYAYGDDDELCSFKDCSVYVETVYEESWDDPNNDPYSKYTVSGTYVSGGIVGKSTQSEFVNCYSSVKISGQYSGGLIGWGGGNIVTDCAVFGHTYEGKFEGTLPNGTAFSLKDNVYGELSAGGIIGTVQSFDIEFKGTVFSACSVTGTEDVDVLVSADSNISFVTESDPTVYSLGTAYLPDGTEKTESAVTDSSGSPLFKSAADYSSYDKSMYVYLYDTHNRFPSFKYPVPAGMTMHGDWPSNDEDISGFFYWEEHGGNYYVHVLCSGKEYDNLCKKQDGVGITGYGYGAFSVGNDITSSITDGADFAVITSESGEASFGFIAEEVRKALKDDALAEVVGELSSESAVNVELYMSKNPISGIILAQVNGKSYAFAPSFYALKEGENVDFFGIRAEGHLRYISADGNKVNLGEKYVQSHDIDVSGKTELMPIGDNANPFIGTYDGGSYRIIGARFNKNSDGNIGLFGKAVGASLENIVLFNPASDSEEFIQLGGTTNESLASVDSEPSPAYISAPYNESLAAVDGGSGNIIPSNYDTPFVEKKYSDSEKSFYEFTWDPNSDEFSKMINSASAESSYDGELVFDFVIDEGLTFFSSVELTIENETWNEGQPWEVLGTYEAERIDSSGFLIWNNKIVYEARVKVSDIKSPNKSPNWNKKVRFTYKVSRTYNSDFTVKFSFSHNHVFEKKSVDEKYHSKECKLYGCGYKELFEHEIEWTSLDESGHKGKCKDCNYEMTNSEAHKYGPDKKCTICGYQTTHNYEIKSNETQHWYQCTDEGCTQAYGWENHVPSGDLNADGKHFCIICNAAFDHQFANEWQKDENMHWHKCNIAGCTAKGSEEKHTLVWKTDSEQHWKECSVCGYMTEKQNHTGGTEWQSNDSTHYYVCPECNQHYHSVAHTLGEATDNGDGTHSHTCSVCGKEVTSKHTMSKWTESLTEPGKHTRKCTGCDYAESGEHDFGTGGTLEKCKKCGAVNSAVEEFHTITDAVNVGGIVAVAENTTISNCVVSGYIITGNTSSGGIVGDSTGKTIEACEANVKLSGDGNVGGIAGKATAKIDNCYALVHGYDGTADETLGGIAGQANEVTNCYVVFSGQITGYPIARISSAGGNHYVRERGYYQGNPAKENYGEKYTLNTLKSKRAPASDQISYMVKSKDEINKYDYTAVVKDKVANSHVHYGPLPGKAALETETLTEGPLVGIFNVKQYQDSGYDSNDYDGLMVYNRSGMLNWDEVVIDGTGKRHVGIFIANPDDPKVASKPYLILDKGIYSEKLAVYVNGERVEPERFKAYGITAGVGRARSGYYHYGFSNDPTVKYNSNLQWGQATSWITDTFFDSNNPGADANSAFMYYVICKDDGTEMTPDEIESIEIKYDNPETGIKGSLLRADKEKQSLNNTDHMAYLPASRIDEWEMPEIGAFIAGSNYGEGFRTNDMPYYVYPYAMKLTITKNGTTTTKGMTYHHEANGVLGIAIKKDQLDQYYDGNIKFQVNSIPVDLVPWDEQMNVDICNADALGLDDYEIFVVAESDHVDPLQFNTSWIDFTAIHGSRILFKYTYGTLLSQTTEGMMADLMPNFTLAALYYDKESDKYYAQGYRSGCESYPTILAGNNVGGSYTGSFALITNGSTSDFKIKVNDNYVDIDKDCSSEILNLGSDEYVLGGKTAYWINITESNVDKIEVYYKDKLIMTKYAGEF